MSSRENKPASLATVIAATAIAAAPTLLRGFITPIAADIFSIALAAIIAAFVTYRMWKKQTSVQEGLAGLTVLAAILGAQIAGSVFKNDAAAYAIVLTATISLLFFFSIRLVRSNGASWWYNLAGVIASVGVSITIIGLMLFRGISEANYLLIIALVGVFCAIVALDKGQKIDATTHKQIDRSGEVLKAEPIREKVKRERI